MRRHLVPLLSVLLAAVLSTVLTAAPAQAHTRLVSSTPAAGTPAEAPGEVVLVFSEPVQAGLSALSVTGADGEEHVSGTPAAGGDGGSVSQALHAPLAPGTYRVAYRVLAADGHPVTGAFEITATAPAATDETPAAVASTTVPPTPEGTTTGALTPTAGQGDEDDGGLPVLPLVLGGLLLAGAAGLLARRLGGSPEA